MVKLEQIELMITHMIEEINASVNTNNKYTNHNSNNSSNLLTNRLIRSFQKIRPLWKQLQFHYTHTIVIITYLNSDFIAPQFFAFMIISAPLNCILVYSLLFKDIPTISVVLILAAVIQEISCHFVIHLFLAKLNQRIMSPLKCFRSLTIMIDSILGQQSDNKSLKFLLLFGIGVGGLNKYGRYVNIHNHIQWHCFLCNYINKRKYGFTYNKFGTISMGTFVKVIQCSFYILLI